MTGQVKIKGQAWPQALKRKKSGERSKAETNRLLGWVKKITTLNLPAGARAETFHYKGKDETLPVTGLHGKRVGESHFQGHEGGEVFYRRKGPKEAKERGLFSSHGVRRHLLWLLRVK